MGGSVRFAGHNFQRSLVFCFIFLFFLWVSDGRGGTERTETIIPITNYVSLFVLSSIAKDKKSIGGGGSCGAKLIKCLPTLGQTPQFYQAKSLPEQAQLLTFEHTLKRRVKCRHRKYTII